MGWHPKIRVYQVTILFCFFLIMKDGGGTTTVSVNDFYHGRRRATDTEEALIPVITPVRRSARFSTTRTASASEGRLPPGTPRVTEYSALGEVPSEERERMLFHPNRALEPLLRDESPEIKRLSLDEAL